MCVFSVTVLVLITPIWSYRVVVLRPTPPWPSQDSLASCKSAAALLRVHPGFSNFCFDKHTFARNVAIRYVNLLLFAMDVVLGLPTSAKLREAPAGASTKHVSMGKAKPILPLLLMFLPVCVG